VLKALLHLNTSSGSSLDIRKSKILNLISLFVAFLATVLLIVNLIYNHEILALLDLLVILILIIPTLYLQFRKKYNAATFVLISGLILITYMGVLEALSLGNFTDSEYLYIGYLLLVIVLMEGKTRMSFLVLIAAILVFLKVQKFLLMEGELGKFFVLEVVNTSMLAAISCYLVWVFKNSLLKALQHADDQKDIVYSLIDNLPLFIGMLDRKGKYVVVNKQYELTFNKDVTDIIGRHYTEILPENILSTHKEFVEMTMRGLSPSFSEKLELPDYNNGYVSGKYYPVYGDDGEIKYVTVYVSDVTELKETEKALSRANKTKSELFSIISHDLRSPLSLLSNVITVVEMDSMSKDEFSRFLQELKSKTKNLLGTVDNILSWAKSQLEQIVSEPEVINLNDTVAEVIMLHSDKAAEKNLDIRFEPDRNYEVFVDQNHLRLVLRNILHNSLKFTEKGHVKFLITEDGSSKDEQTICVEIEDTGIGMDQSTIDKLLNPENVESRAGTRGEMGTGLGMSISLRLLEMNNCRIEIESHPDQGSRFKIFIPSQSKK
jgi:PAS domain S-box-containing protein